MAEEYLEIKYWNVAMPSEFMDRLRPHAKKAKRTPAMLAKLVVEEWLERKERGLAEAANPAPEDIE